MKHSIQTMLTCTTVYTILSGSPSALMISSRSDWLKFRMSLAMAWARCREALAWLCLLSFSRWLNVSFKWNLDWFNRLINSWPKLCSKKEKNFFYLILTYFYRNLIIYIGVGHKNPKTFFAIKKSTHESLTLQQIANIISC